MDIQLKKSFRDCIAAQNELSTKNSAIYVLCSCGQGFWKHRLTRNDRCCLCRAKVRAEYIRHRSGTGADPLPGYPKQPFQNMEELRTYFSQQKIECLECGRQFRALNTHVKRVHGFPSIKDYKFKFGLPFTYGAVGVATSTLLSISSKANFESHDANWIAEFRRKCREAQKGLPRPDQLHGSQVLLRLRRDIIKKAIASPNHISNLTDLIPWHCSRCGASTEASEMATITKSCAILCHKCRVAAHKESKQRWANKKGIDLKEFQRDISRRAYLRNKARTTSSLPT